MEKLTEKKRKWIITQFRVGGSATTIAKTQKISRRMVYKLVAKYKKEGIKSYKATKERYANLKERVENILTPNSVDFTP
ncbi:MAG: helix-turn-helix domain-containing protein [Nanoarchaeota archaeon]|nr:helix-turn-helix domain-containing protein [Nanoarchaeota archaeon]